jgi:hypothetical protein
MPARKKTSKKTGKKSATKKAAATRKTAGAKQTTKPIAKKAPAKKATKKASTKKAEVSSGLRSLDINMGHIFALRPRVPTSFRPGDLQTARHQLQDEAYAKIEHAARAVAEKALELTHDAGSRLGSRRQR